MRAGTTKQIFLGAGIALGVAAGGCYGDYAGTTSNGNGSGSGSGSGTGSTGSASGTGAGSGGGTAPNHPDGGAATTNNNYDTTPGCTSNSTAPFTGGDGTTGAGMSPGEACISCHSSGEGPRLHVAGTVYPTAHETANCVSTSTTITVVVSDSAGHVFKLPTTANGNFACGDKARSGFPACAGFTPPYNAYVVDANNVYRPMGASQTSGDCNSCHTPTGTNSAPGRIMAP